MADLSPDTKGLLSSRQVRGLMRRSRRTIRELSRAMGITQKRCRAVRAAGTPTHYHTRDWVQAITGTDPGSFDPSR